MTLTDFFQGNQEQESNKTPFDVTDVTTLEMNDPNGSTAIELFGSALNGPSSLTFSSSSLPNRDRFTELEMHIDAIESRLTGIEADAITDIMARLATINERLGTLEAGR